MTALTRRETERDARVDWILDAALEVVVHEGLGALTTPRLAKKLGYTPAAFYRYFDSKDALMLALETRTALRYYARFFSVFEAAVAALPKLSKRPRALAEILLAVAVYSELARAEPMQFKVVSVLVSGDRSWMTGDASQQLNAQLMPRVAQIIGLFAMAAEVSALDEGNAAHRAVGVWIALHALLAAAPMARAVVDIRALTDDHVMSLLRGFGAAPRDLEAARDAVTATGSGRTP